MSIPQARQKWLCYASGSFFLVLLQMLFLDQIRLLQAHPFLLPMLISTAAIYEGSLPGGVFGLLLGLCCDLLLSSGPTVWFYTIAFTLSALAAAMLAKYLISPGFLCAAAGAILSFALTDLLRFSLYAVQSRMSPLLLLLAGKELLLSLPFVLPVNALFRRIHCRFSSD